MGNPYSQSLSASGGITPYIFSQVAGTLPPGLGLSAAGLISGVPAAGGTYTFTIQAADSWDVLPLAIEKQYTVDISYRALMPFIRK